MQPPHLTKEEVRVWFVVAVLQTPFKKKSRPFIPPVPPPVVHNHFHSSISILLSIPNVPFSLFREDEHNDNSFEPNNYFCFCRCLVRRSALVLQTNFVLLLGLPPNPLIVGSMCIKKLLLSSQTFKLEPQVTFENIAHTQFTPKLYIKDLF